MEADTESGTLRAERAENSYVGPIDDGQVIGIAFLDGAGASETQDHDDEIVVHLYDREGRSKEPLKWNPGVLRKLKYY
ncbi:hypothetical protein [Halegenticoccus tardaugens]|uniref:hypothetical protein n=1 Tax=Halegenticoccus tardaugens TaxID=2071624 RepID=UPI00100BF8DF|nr:hypothetical protein [Halegenticoccus tardaugens]